jgi:hypothetical protein
MTTDSTDDKELRKAWLKKKFGSFEYHEELMELHARWLALIKQALARARGDPAATQPSKWFCDVAVPNFKKAPKPGQIDPTSWRPGEYTGWARSILDYRHDTGLEDPSAWDWMTPSEQDAMYSLWVRMMQNATNIRRTVDDSWFSPRRGHDDDLLNEEDTGPIDWPANWRQEIEGSSSALRVTAERPVPRDGLWQSVDSAARQQRARAGDTLPDLHSGYGLTVWEWIGE